MNKEEVIKKTSIIQIALKKCEERVDKYGGFIMVVLLCVVVEFSWWAIESDRPGSEIALIIGSVYATIVGMLKYLLEHARFLLEYARKND